MYQAITQINTLFTAAIDNAAPTANQPTEEITLTEQDKAFFVWLARHG